MYVFVSWGAATRCHHFLTVHQRTGRAACTLHCVMYVGSKGREKELKRPKLLYEYTPKTFCKLGRQRGQQKRGLGIRLDLVVQPSRQVEMYRGSSGGGVVEGARSASGAATADSRSWKPRQSEAGLRSGIGQLQDMVHDIFSLLPARVGGR